MKSSVWWSKFNSHNRLARRLCTPLTAALFGWLGWVLICSFWLERCEEKLPLLPLDTVPVAFGTSSIDYMQIEDTTRIVSPHMGGSSYLYVGHDENIEEAWSLLRFDNFSALPDPLDSIESLRLQIYALVPLTNDTTLEVSVLLLDAPGLARWDEDSLKLEDFDFSAYQLTEIARFNCAAQDTYSIDLPDTVIRHWRNTNNANHGIVLRQSNTSPSLGYFYSGETNMPPFLEVTYQASGVAVTKAIAVSADIALLKYRSSVANVSGRNLISGGLAGYTFMKFKVEDLITDPNLFIASAQLHLSLDTNLTRRYSRSQIIYLSLLDSSDWNDPAYAPNTSSYDLRQTITTTDTAVVLKIPITIQRFTSGYHKNFGVALWASPSNVSPALLGFHAANSEQVQYRPHLEILVMKEE